ncbi:MAG: PKD domain-containing protein [Gammaproteobacteria bacterium]
MADPLTYHGAFTAKPTSSTAALSGADTATPTFVADRPGSYDVKLIVNEGQSDSTPDTVRLSTANSAPSADAGTDQTAFVGKTATLDGTASSDVDGDPITYQWSFTTKPVGSQAVLSDPTFPQPSFTVDKASDYLIQLIVNDGKVDSAPDSVQVSTRNSAPVANAGPDQSVFVNTTVQLDGSQSSDADGDPLTYRWSLLNKPANSAAVLANDQAVNPSFTVDKPGSYTVQLIVNDGTVDSPPDQIVVSQNSRPVANAGADQTATVGDTVTLDGNGSQDADGDNLSFAWSLITQPANGAVTLTGADTATPTFIPDQAGEYTAQLIVSDGQLDSNPDTALVTVNAAPMNQPPQITSTPVITATVGTPYSYDAAATDPEGDALICSLTVSPSGMTIDSATGLINWTPNAAGDAPVRVQVADSEGAMATQSFTVTVSEALVTVPDVVGQTRAAAEAAITAAQLTVGTVTEESAGVPAGNVISQDPTAGTQASPSTAVNLVVSLGPTGGGGRLPAQTVEEKWVALDAVKAKFDSLPGLDRNADNEEMLNLLRSRPEFVDAGIDVASSSVWANFADGDPIVIFNNRTLPDQPVIALQPRSTEPLTNTAASAGAESAQPFDASPPRDALRAASLPELPFSSAVRFLNTFGSLGSAAGDAIVELRRILTRQNYVPVAEEAVTLEALKTVGGDGVFYISTHGGFWRLLNGRRTFGLTTATRADLGIDRALTDDILDRRIVRALAKVEFDVLTGTWRSGWRYAFTAAWVRNYWTNFSANSFVYIDACNSDDPDQTAQDFKTAVLAKNVSVYAGWTGLVDDRIAADTAQLVFQRLLGDDPTDPHRLGT